MTVKSIPKRNEVPENLTWDLTTIFKDEARFKVELDQVKAEVATVNQLAGKLANSADDLLQVVEKVLNLNRRFEKVYVYAHLNHDVDTANNGAQVRMEQVEALGTKLSEATSWFDPEIINLGKVKIDAYMATQPKLTEYDRLFKMILKDEGHVLSIEAEKLLSGASNIFNAPEKIFSMMDSSDFVFPEVKDEQGNTVRLSNGLYSLLLQSTDQNVRREAFQKFYTVFNQFKHTLAATLSSEVAVNNYQAQVHHFSSAREQAMHENEIPAKVFTTLVKTVNDNLPLLHRYVALRKKILKISEMHMYDMYVPLAQTPDVKYTFAESKKIMLQALQVMGPDYVKHVEEELNNRWIDVVENKGKRTGAYSSGVYDTNPYILLNWQDNLDNLYTLIHETGHSMHSYYSSHNQPYQYGDYSIFVAEIASTTNENILTDYLLANTNDPEMKKYILSQYLEGFKGTIFRQTQFAEFENWIHEQGQLGKSLTADVMSEKYKAINEKYYGDEIISDPEIAIEWSRIPHFYYDFYVYQYATGFGAASTLAEKISSGNQAAIDAYLNYLKSGSSDTPINIMKRAGVDMTNSQYLEAAFAKFSQRMDELEKLIEA
ncbi:oligoendopeptidase F [Fructilactobacillus frigidiflavus]|uniref:oligoendopeptidase F n=1 Tax=Fructilactobacillus frigidiflavus TaxID=3242688 RepID=UPI003757AFA6